MSLFYDIFIYPLELLMKLFLESVLFATGSPLFSLICLSFAVTLVSSPIYHIAEKWQDKEREIQKKLKPKIDEFKSVFKGAALNNYINTLYRQNNYHPFYAIRASLGIIIQIPFFFAAYSLLSDYSDFNGLETFLFSDLGKPDRIITLGFVTINIMPFIMTGINFLSAKIYSRKTSKKETVQVYGIAVLFLIVLYNAPSALIFYWTFNNIFSLLKNLAYNRFYENGIIIDKKKETKISCKVFRFIPPHRPIFDTVFKLSVLSLSFLSFISIPLTVLSSGSGADFEKNLSYYLSYLIIFTLIFFTLIFILYKSLPPKGKSFLSIFFVFLVFYGLVNSFVFIGDYGDMSHFIFNHDLEISSLQITLSILSGVLILTGISTVFVLSKTKWLKPVLVVILISLIIFSVKEAQTFSGKRKGSSNASIIEEENFYTFSKNGKNVIILMLDRFIGGYMPQILELLPNLKTDLDGFIYYQNTLSPASYTIAGVPPILGGWEYEVTNVNSTRQDVPLLKKLDESSRILPYNFNKAGFDVKVYQTDCINWFDKTTSWIDKKNPEYIGDSRFIEPDYPKLREMWLHKYKKENREEEDDSVRKKLIAFGFFRVAPVFLRELIYDDGEWHIEKDEEPYEKPDKRKYVSTHQKSRHRKDTTLKYYAALDFLPDFSRVLEEGNNQYFYLSNNLPHEPHSINSDFEFEITGRVSYPRTIYNKFGKSMKAVRHLYTDATALRLINKWFDWMKENGVYDNTRIIIVSDHGRDIFNPFFKQQKIPGSRRRAHPSYFNNLLLIKDFDQRGKLRIRKKFMSSPDIPALATEGLFEATNPYTGNKIEMPENKFPFHSYDVQWRVEKQSKYKYRYHEGYIINSEKDINSPSKWRVIK